MYLKKIKIFDKINNYRVSSFFENYRSHFGSRPSRLHRPRFPSNGWSGSEGDWGSSSVVHCTISDLQRNPWCSDSWRSARGPCMSSQRLLHLPRLFYWNRLVQRIAQVSPSYHKHQVLHVVQESNMQTRCQVRKRQVLHLLSMQEVRSLLGDQHRTAHALERPRHRLVWSDALPGIVYLGLCSARCIHIWINDDHVTYDLELAMVGLVDLS